MRRLLVACAVVAAAAASALPPGGAAPVPTHLMPKTPPFAHPTAVGSTWVYDANGAEMTLTVTAVERTERAHVVTVEQVQGGRTVPYNKVSVGPDGLSMTEETSRPYTPPWRQLATPIGREHTWDLDLARDDIGGGIKGSTRQAERLERVKVPAGEFDAVRVEATYRIGGNAGGATKTTRWYAPGVGLVKMDNWLQLKSFTPGKG